MQKWQKWQKNIGILFLALSQGILLGIVFYSILDKIDSDCIEFFYVSIIFGCVGIFLPISKLLYARKIKAFIALLVCIFGLYIATICITNSEAGGWLSVFFFVPFVVSLICGICLIFVRTIVCHKGFGLMVLTFWLLIMLWWLHWIL
ncbi:Uncharacterised protein [Helicobacter fennelliae]|uniref:Uncharacterized protein n=1 Tax=Helicobacter fennelliae TaxID=215 RepID=A0A2X3BQJ3_9HELI|nr:hypothetical protein [Helicobacter fennelliae]SQB98435.1 Uncharacterised protein [Helicobacter fennelliae]